MRTSQKRRQPLRKRRNRKVRPLRERLPSPGQVLAFAQRVARRGVPVWIAMAAVAIVSTGLWFGYGWLTTSERFEIRTVHVRGANHLCDDDVRIVAAVPPASNVFRVDLSAIEDRLEDNPWIESAKVDRRLPDQLIIDVVERTPAALVELDGLYLAEADGHLFKRAAIERGEGNDLPIITGLDRDDYLAEPSTAEAAIRTGLDTLAAYQKAEQRPAIGEIHIDPRRGITLVTYDTALALRLGGVATLSNATTGPNTKGATHASKLGERLAAFDTAWHALDEDERDAARVIFMDNQVNPDRITVQFGGTH